MRNRSVLSTPNAAISVKCSAEALGSRLCNSSVPLEMPCCGMEMNFPMKSPPRPPLLRMAGHGVSPWVEEQQTRNWPKCTDHHEIAHKKSTYCTRRVKKVEKPHNFFSGAVRVPPLSNSLRRHCHPHRTVLVHSHTSPHMLYPVEPQSSSLRTGSIPLCPHPHISLHFRLYFQDNYMPITSADPSLEYGSLVTVPVCQGTRVPEEARPREGSCLGQSTE